MLAYFPSFAFRNSQFIFRDRNTSYDLLMFSLDITSFFLIDFKTIIFHDLIDKRLESFGYTLTRKRHIICISRIDNLILFCKTCNTCI